MTIESPQVEDTRMDVGAILGAVLSRWLRILIVTLLLAGATYAVLMVTPKLYESNSSILVESRANAFTGPAAAGTSSGGAATTIDSVISSQIELIKSRDTLLKVVDAVNLRSVPEFNGSGPNPMNLVFQLFGRKPEQKSIDDTVLANLSEKVTVIRERDSAIISIFVRSQSPQLAADIANAIANEHVKRRADQSLQDTAEASTWLEQEIVKLRQRVAEAETAVANFRNDNDLFQGSNNTSLLDQQLSNIATQITDAQQRRNAAQSRATLIRGMIDAGQPIAGLADVQSSTVIQQLNQSKADLQGQLAQRSSTLLPNHPTMKALAAQIREIDRQIATEGRRVAASLEAEAKIEGDLEASLQNDLSRLKQSAASAATSTVTLEELQREAKAQRDLLENYLLRYREAVSRSDSASTLPDVRVVSIAAPSVTPASPKTGLLLGAVIFAALALQIGAIMLGELMSGRAVVQRVVVTHGGRGPGPGGEPVPSMEANVQDDPAEPLLPFDRPMPARTVVAGPATVMIADAGAEIASAEDQIANDAESPVEPAAPASEADETRVVVAAVETEQADLAREASVDEAVADDVESPSTAEVRTLASTEAALDELAAAMAQELEDDRAQPVSEVVADETKVTSSTETAPEPAPEQVAIAEAEEAAVATDEASDEEKVDEPADAPAVARPGPVDDDEDLRRPYAPAPIQHVEMPEPTGRYPSALATLSADIALGRVRVVMVAGLSAADDCQPVVDTIVAEALYAGLTIVRVDAGSAEVSPELGITDLATERASFGDVVHKGMREGLAEVPWGQQMVLDRRSNKPNTLIEALTDIYEVVVVSTGRVGLSSTLPLFTGINCRLVLASVGRPSSDHLEAALADTAALGFRHAQVVIAPLRHAEVA